MRGRTVSIGLGALAALLLLASPASAQLPAPSPCCDKVCNADGSSTACGALDVTAPDGAVISGCLDVGPVVCIGGLALNQEPPELTEGCGCALVAPDLCLNIDIPPGMPGLGPVQSTEECTREAVAACETGGNVIEIACDPDCGCTPAEDCDNGTDDDGDGDVDCDDADCAGDPVCAPGVEDCDNGTDDDGDGDVDCDDADCAGDPACQAPPAECGDGVCDDGEECFVDCGPGVCSDSADNDGDGKVDCADKDCREGNRSGGGDDTNPGGGGNPSGFCNPGGLKKSS
jgi:hypothetical protein